MILSLSSDGFRQIQNNNKSTLRTASAYMLGVKNSILQNIYDFIMISSLKLISLSDTDYSMFVILVEDLPKSIIEPTDSNKVISMSTEVAVQSRNKKSGFHLVICFIGLLASYLTWGLLQEKIMTKQYVDSRGFIGQFSNSQFLVFVNRILAFAVAALYIVIFDQPTHR